MYKRLVFALWVIFFLNSCWVHQDTWEKSYSDFSFLERIEYKKACDDLFKSHSSYVTLNDQQVEFNIYTWVIRGDYVDKIHIFYSPINDTCLLVERWEKSSDVTNLVTSSRSSFEYKDNNEYWDKLNQLMK